MTTAKEEFEDLLASMSEEQKNDLEAIPFNELPLDILVLHSVMETIPRDIKERHGPVIRRIIKLNGLMRLTMGQKEEKSPEPLVTLTEELTKEITFKDVGRILETSIKKDDAAKLITFCGMLLAQTEDDQINVGFQEQSSAGKSYIPLEVSVYFPLSEVKRIGGATPTAFTYEQGKWDDERKAVIVDLEGKILIFLDMPDYRLLERLRPLLAHDWKEIEYKTTDKSQKHGLRTKTAIIRGYPSVFFCTTKTDPDEQEKTRLILVSPSTDQAKIDESLKLTALRKGNYGKYRKDVLEDPARVWLSDRIRGIRQLGVRHIILPEDGAGLYRKFKASHPYLLARHQRDFPRIISFVKAHTLLNCFHREKIMNGHADKPAAVLASQSDINAGLSLYSLVESSNELGLSPYTYRIYEQVLQPLLDPESGVKRKEFRRRFFSVFHKTLPERQEYSVLSQIEAAGLITQEPDPGDRRQNLIYPTHPADISVPTLRTEDTR